MFSGIENPTDRDRVGLAVAEEQLNLILGLRAIRIKRGMSVSDVADAMGIDPSQVSRFEGGGTNPTFSTVRRYAKAVLGVFRIETRTWEVVQVRAAESKIIAGNPLSPVPHAEPPTSGAVNPYYGLHIQVEVHR